MNCQKLLRLSVGVGCVLACLSALADNPPEKQSGSDEAQAFLEKLDKVLAAANDQPTTETKNTAVAKAVHDLDAEMRTKTLSFRFPISDVVRVQVRRTKQKPPANQMLKLDLPEGAQLSWEVRKDIELKMNNSDAAELVPGDVLVVTGTPRLFVATRGGRPSDKGNTIWVLQSKSGSDRAVIYLQGWTHKIEHAKK